MIFFRLANKLVMIFLGLCACAMVLKLVSNLVGEP